MIPALIVGGYTAWFLGLRTGVIAAVSVAVGLLVAGFVPVPGISLVVYALILGWCGALFFFGRKMAGGSTQRSAAAGIVGELGSLAARARQMLKR